MGSLAMWCTGLIVHIFWIRVPYCNQRFKESCQCCQWWPAGRRVHMQIYFWITIKIVNFLWNLCWLVENSAYFDAVQLGVYYRWEDNMLITMAAWSKAWTVFTRSTTGIMVSNPTRGMDVCVRLFCVNVFLCVGKQSCDGLITRPRSPTVCVKKITKLKKRSGPNKGL
jgi:hypothetical protein